MTYNPGGHAPASSLPAAGTTSGGPGTAAGPAQALYRCG
jgi:hypothetical protein